MYEVIFEADNGKKFVFGRNGNNYFYMSIANGVDVNLGTSQGFSQVGETVENQSVAGRPIDVTGEVYGNVTARKDALRNVCAPLTSGRLVFQNTWFIRVFVKSAPTFMPVKNNGRFKMQFFAPYPFFSTMEEKQYQIGSVIPMFRFPVNYSKPHRFGTRNAERYTNIINSGDVRIPYTLTLRSEGISTNPTVTNLTTFSFLRLNGVLEAGDVATIYWDSDNVLRAELTSGGVTTDIASWIDDDSELYELEVGDNLIQANDDEGGAGLVASITFRPAVVALYET